MRQIIAFAGRARSGKDTAADIVSTLYKEQDTESITFAFANILKDIASRSLRIPIDEYDVLKDAPNARIANGLTMREFLNTLGDAMKSYLGDDLWARLSLEAIHDIDSMVNIPLAICTDLRYPIEQDALIHYCLTNDIELIIIKMKNTSGPKRDDNLSQSEHESEYLVDQITEDYSIEAKSPEEIQEKLKVIFNEIKIKEEKD